MCVRPTPLILHLIVYQMRKRQRKLTYHHIVQQTTKRIKLSTLEGRWEKTIRKDVNKNQIFTNINYEQNSLSIF